MFSPSASTVRRSLLPIPGMSDIYALSLQPLLHLHRRYAEGYLQAFAAELANATRDFKPDIIQSNHLWL